MAYETAGTIITAVLLATAFANEGRMLWVYKMLTQRTFSASQTANFTKAAPSSGVSGLACTVGPPRSRRILWAAARR